MPEGPSLEPDPSGWLQLARRTPRGEWDGRPIDDWRRLTRQQLGVPEDRLVIVTGHQAGIWHPGILAKFIAADAVCDAADDDAAAVHLVVDQDDNSVGAIDVPALRPDGSLAAETLRLLPNDSARPTGERPASVVTRPRDDARYARPSVAAGVEWIVRALGRHQNEASAAGQAAHAVSDLMSRWVSPMRLVFASDLLSTGLGASLLEQMRRDPERCAASYNRAARARPGAGVRALMVRGEHVELPIWRLDDAGRRHPAFAIDLDDDQVAAARLRPRALLMTAIIRLAVADLFIHGRGGRAYDGVMAAWLADWIGLTPAPAVMATADLRLPLAGLVPEAPPVECAITQHRRCWHDPPTCDDPAPGRPSDHKRRWLDAIESAPRGSIERRRAFHDMHEWLEAGRADRAGQLESARQAVMQARRSAAAGAVVSRRNWPFPLYSLEAIDGLAEAIEAAFEVADPQSPLARGERG